MAFQSSHSIERLLIRGLLIGLYLAGAVLIAYWIGTGETQLLIYTVLLAIVSAVSFGLQRHAWVVIPLTWLLYDQTAVLPLGLSIRDSAIFLAACAYFGHRIVGREPRVIRQTVVDWMIWMNVFYIMLTFIIHPVGVHILGAETIGARPYFVVLLALIAYQILVRAPDSPKAVGRIPRCILASAVFVSGLFLLAYIFPNLPGKIPILFAALDVSLFSASVNTAQEIPRFQRLADLGLMLSLVLCSYYPPRTLFNPLRWRFWFFMIALICVMAAGYRSVMLSVLASLLIGSWLHRGWAEVALALGCGVVLFGLVTVGQGRFYELPLPAQRTLAFLPGRWSTQVMDDVHGSNEGRFQWWRDIIKYKMIKNWWVGDGFGTSAHDLELIWERGTVTDSIMATGAYHNGPLTAIHFVGVIGLLLLYALMVTTAVVAFRCVAYCRGGPLFGLAVFIAIQAIWAPFYYTFVFGGYNIAMPSQILLAGLARLVIRMLEGKKTAAAVEPLAAISPLPVQPLIRRVRHPVV